MSPLIEDHPIISYDTSSCEPDEKFLIEECIELVFLLSESELSSDDLSTSIYLEEADTDFWS